MKIWCVFMLVGLVGCGGSDFEDEPGKVEDAGADAAENGSDDGVDAGADVAPTCSDAGVNLDAIDAWCSEVCAPSEPCGDFVDCYDTCFPCAESSVARCTPGIIWSYTPAHAECSPFDVEVPCSTFSCG